MVDFDGELASEWLSVRSIPCELSQVLAPIAIARTNAAGSAGSFTHRGAASPAKGPLALRLRRARAAGGDGGGVVGISVGGAGGRGEAAGALNPSCGCMGGAQCGCV